MKLPKYEDSLLAISSSILKYYNCETSYPTMADVDKELSKGYKHVFLWIIDGMGHENMKEIYKSTDFIRKKEVRPMSAIYPSTTAAATTTASCGLPPLASGWVGWHQYFKEYNDDFIMFLDFCFYKKDQKCPRNIEFDLMKCNFLWEQIKEKGYFADFIYPNFRTPRVKTFQDQCDLVLEYANDPTKEGFTYVYWDWLDHEMHDHGVTSKEVMEHGKLINDCLEDLQKKLPDDTLLIVSADHGHVDIEYVDLDNYPSLVNMFERYPSIEGRAMTFFIKEGMQEDFKKEFEHSFHNQYILYSHDEFFEKGFLGNGKEHPRIHEFIGDFMACAISNQTFIFRSGGPKKGNHAGLTDKEMTTPLIFINHKKPSGASILENRKKNLKIKEGKNFQKIVGKPKDSSAFRRVNFNG